MAPSPLKTSRPRFWIYVFGPYLLGAAAMIASGHAAHHLLPLIIFGLYFLFPANLLIYGVNDIFDYETDILNSKKKGYESLVKPDERAELAKLIAATNIPFILFGALFLPPVGLLGLIGFLFFGIFYSMPPLRAKVRPFIDASFNILYVFPALVSFGFLGVPPLHLLFAAALWCMAMHIYSAVPDITADSRARMATTATVLGLRGALILCLALYTAAAALAFINLGPLAILLGGMYVAMMITAIAENTEAGVRKLYTYFPLMNTVVGFILTVVVLAC